MSNKKVKSQYEAYKAESRQAKNQAAKRARHAKRYPNDLQSIEKAVAGYKRKKPIKRGSAPAAARFIRDASGKKNCTTCFCRQPKF